MSNLLDLSGKVILIAGGSRGIGAQMAWDYAEQGANLIISSRSLEACVRLGEDITTQYNVDVLPLRCDMASLEDIKNMYAQTMERFGKIDIIVNNAGVNRTKPAIEVTEDDFNFIFDVNIKGLFFSCQEAAKIMIDQGHGKIINISSVGGLKPYKRIAPYTASKAAVIHLTKSLASEWARYGVIVNSIAPGLISTEINEEEFENEKWLNKVMKTIPMRKLGDPKDISNLGLYLASELSNYITGQTFPIDGGTLTE
ncbi:3-oxoacyl-[acyl-carrier protein] reductase [Lentibacillus persicus]|uniref:3-oxoacyl-[acyl-carrier protein] reductase n=1 Tax=Lentibacillus persicus TaxID=640948 RepID=A0A1I1S995_9BACI|nr:SDR family oxidoreductase [Lentibacillus persicus]SFD42922.1 3-oxoacyl-[acyl-carrier protein] reductase [Lentibacillus persicus]